MEPAWRKNYNEKDLESIKQQKPTSEEDMK